MFKITHAKWSNHCIGIACKRLHSGDSSFKVTIKLKDGKDMFPGVYKINKETAEKNFPLEVINKHHLMGYWIPFDKLPEMRADKK